LDKANKIREHMPVVSSNGTEFATVDHMDGNYIKLTKDDQGQHHWIPAEWVKKVDQHVHLDRPDIQAMREWTSTAPAGAGMAGSGSGSEAPI
jgi:hypothetical protein